MKTMGMRIRTLRERKGLTQEQLAERMGVSAQAVSKWENDQSCPDISTLPQLAEILGVSCDTLLGKEPMPEKSAPDKDEKEGESIIEHSLRLGKLVFPIAVLVFGAELLLNLLLKLNIGFWDILWTNALTFVGISMLIGRVSAFSIGVTLVGLYFALKVFGIISFPINNWMLIVSALVILWGVGMLIDVLTGKRRKLKVKVDGKEMFEQSVEDGYVSTSCSFCERKAYANAPILRGGDVNLSFGSLTLDLRDCEKIADDASIDLNSSFGKLTVILPHNVRAEVSDSASFAHVDCDNPPAGATQKLHLNCNASFGEIKIKYA